MIRRTSMMIGERRTACAMRRVHVSGKQWLNSQSNSSIGWKRFLFYGNIIETKSPLIKKQLILSSCCPWGLRFKCTVPRVPIAERREKVQDVIVERNSISCFDKNSNFLGRTLENETDPGSSGVEERKLLSWTIWPSVWPPSKVTIRNPSK